MIGISIKLSLLLLLLSNYMNAMPSGAFLLRREKNDICGVESKGRDLHLKAQILTPCHV